MTAPATRPLLTTRPLLVALYVVAVSFALPSLLEFLLISYPYEFGSPQRRFGAVGLIYNSVLASPLVGLLIATFAAVQLGHRRVVRTLAIVAFVVAALLIIAAPFFVLDFLQLRTMINPQAKRAFDLTSAKASIVGALMCLTAIAIGLGAWRAVPPNSGQRATARPPRKGVIVGASPAEAPQA